MQQLGRRAGALDVDLISNQPGEMALLSSSAQGWMRENMDNVRGPRRIYRLT